MLRRLQKSFIGFVTVLGLTGCSSLVIQERPAWRLQAENACLARGAVQESATIVSAREMNGPGICGLTHPFKVTALSGGSVTINSTQTLGCPMIEALDSWLKDVVQPAAQARFGEPVVRINSMGSYSCRGINNMSGASLSEHSFGNAIDIGGFVLASGRELNITHGFNGPDEQESAFLHEVHAGACGLFTTVLGPGYNILHYNHFHVDLAMHGSTSHGMRRYCKPVPQSNLPDPPKLDNLPDPPPIEEEMDIARAPMPPPSLGANGSSFVASVPPPPPRNNAAQAYSPLPRQSDPLAMAEPAPVLRHRPPALAASPAVTFAVDEPAPPPAVSRSSPLPRRLPRSEPAPDTDQGMGATEEPAPAQAADVDATGPSEQPAPRPASEPAQGSPADWDVTSSTKR